MGELKSHFKNTHGLNTSNVADVPFKCSECGYLYDRFKSLKRHIVAFHPPDFDEEQDVTGEREESERYIIPDPEEDDVELDYSGITNMKFFDSPVSTEQLSKTINDFITKMRCDVSVPESKVQEFIDASSHLIGQYEQYFLGMFKAFLTAKSIRYNDSHAVTMINKLSKNSLFASVRSSQDNLALLSKMAGYAVPVPREELLGRCQITNTTRVPTGPRKGRRQALPARTIRKTRIVKHVAHYIPAKETLSLILQNKDARDMIQSEIRQEGVLRGFKDGSRFLQHPFLQNHPNALRLSLHLDDVEYRNPLGSRKGNQEDDAL